MSIIQVLIEMDGLQSLFAQIQMQAQFQLSTVRQYYEKATIREQQLVLINKQLVKGRTFKSFLSSIKHVKLPEDKIDEFASIFLKYLQEEIQQDQSSFQFMLTSILTKKYSFHILKHYILQFLEEEKQIPRIATFQPNVKKCIYTFADKYFLQQTNTPNQFSQKKRQKLQKNPKITKLSSFCDNMNKQGNKKVPKFLTEDKQGNRRMSFALIQQIQVTNAFQEQIEEIKQIISSQNTKDGFLSKVFSEFVDTMNLVNSIKQGLYQQFENSPDMDFQMDLYRKYLNQSNQILFTNPDQHSQVYKYWLKLKNNMVRASSERKISKLLIQRALQQCLLFETQVYWIPTKQKGFQYAAAIAPDHILININHIGEMGNIDTFKQYASKPYFYLTLIHQFGHRVLRQTQVIRKQQDDQNGSLQFNQQTISCRILRIVFHLSAQIKLAYQICQIQDRLSSLQKKNLIQGKVREIKLLIMNQACLIEVMKYHMQKFIYLRQYMLALEKNHSVLKSMQKDQDLVKWFGQMFDLISLNEFTWQQDKKPIPQNLYRRYQFVLVLLVSQNIFKLTSMQQIQYYQQKMKRIVESRHVILKTKIIRQKLEFLLRKITIDIPYYEYFSSLCLSGINFLPSLLQELNTFCENTYDHIPAFLKKIQSFSSPQLKAQSHMNIVTILSSPQASKFVQVMFVVQTINKMMEFCKFKEIFLIACDLPSLFRKNLNQRFDSAFYLESLLFPNLKQHLYPSDFLHFKNLSQKNAHLVGQRPMNQIDERHFVSLI